MTIKTKKEEMSMVAMQVILHAGDAKIMIEKALDCIKDFEFEKADEILKEANSKIINAHEEQTKLVQSEAGGTDYPNSLLFNHAQDTLMTTMTYYDMAKQLSAVVRSIKEKMNL